MLTIAEGRVLGSLLEKERTVPDQYPLSMNALLLACNQNTSREPVLHLDEAEIRLAVAELKAGGLLRVVHPAHGKSATRYRQIATELWKLDEPACALVAVLILRGPQTISELRTRTERLHRFDSAELVDAEMIQLERAGHVALLDRQAGHKEPRWHQLLAEQAEIVSMHTTPGSSANSGSLAAAAAERMIQLEARVAKLEAAIGDLLA